MSCQRYCTALATLETRRFHQQHRLARDYKHLAEQQVVRMKNMGQQRTVSTGAQAAADAKAQQQLHGMTSHPPQEQTASRADDTMAVADIRRDRRR